MARVKICEAEFRRLWAAGMSRSELAERFNCSVAWIDNYRQALALEARNPSRFQECYSADDPTPDEIAERARECRERHFAQRRGETEEAARAKAWRHGVLQEQ